MRSGKKEELLEGSHRRGRSTTIFKKMPRSEKLESTSYYARMSKAPSRRCRIPSRVSRAKKSSATSCMRTPVQITTTDLQRAASSNAIIIGFNVSPESGVNSEARHLGVRIKTFRIIYELLDFVEQEMLDVLPVEYREVVRGHAQVKQIFALSHIGNAAGSIVLDGVITMEGKARVLRNKKVVHSGSIASIRHFKTRSTRFRRPQECGHTARRLRGVPGRRHNRVLLVRGFAQRLCKPRHKLPIEWENADRQNYV